MGSRFVSAVLTLFLTMGLVPAQAQHAALKGGMQTGEVVTSVSSTQTCSAQTLWMRGEFGKARFTVDVADTANARSRGLMFVEQMPRSTGMLFVYPRAQRVAFWMKNTLIPLDMIFADARGVVTKVHANAIPGDLTSIPGGDAVQFVLEVNGGLAGQLGIKPGAEMQHPAISDAAWPCA